MEFDCTARGVSRDGLQTALNSRAEANLFSFHVAARLLSAIHIVCSLRHSVLLKIGFPPGFEV